jgi:hypothetical protein
MTASDDLLFTNRDEAMAVFAGRDIRWWPDEPI